MNSTVAMFDLLALAAFVAALIVNLAIPSGPDDSMPFVGKMSMAAAMGVYVLASLFNVVENSGMSEVLHKAEDYIEILFPLLVVYAMYAHYSRRREMDLVASQRAALRSQQMLLGIMDSAPAGILVLDASGRITFANDTAKSLLELTESPSGLFADQDWEISVAGCEPSRTFSGLLKVHSGHEPTLVGISWPSGWRLELSVRTDRLGDSAGRTGGMVVSFLPPDGLAAHAATDA